jgi:hypothetical protein
MRRHLAGLTVPAPAARTMATTRPPRRSTRRCSQPHRYSGGNRTEVDRRDALRCSRVLLMDESGVRAGGQRVVVATPARHYRHHARIIKSGIQFRPSEVGNPGAGAYQVENPRIVTSDMRDPIPAARRRFTGDLLPSCAGPFGVVMEEVQNGRVATDPNFRIVNPGRLPRHSPMKGETRWPP